MWASAVLFCKEFGRRNSIPERSYSSPVILFFRACFPAFWNGGLDVEDLGVIEKKLEEAGAGGADSFHDFLDSGAPSEGSDRASGLGIFGVPSLIVNDEDGGSSLYWGREHLELVRARLGSQYPRATVIPPRLDASTSLFGSQANL